MLATDVAIISPASIGGGQYTFNLHFSVGTQAKFLNVGDRITSAISGNSYDIVTWAVNPSDFVSGGQVTVSFVDVDVAPPQDVGFNSTAFTPGQVDVRPEVRTEGAIGNITTFSGQNYEYQLQAGWNDLTQAAAAIVGDSIVDADGKEFQITFLDVGQFSDPFRVQEVVPEGIAPVAGTASLYRSTSNLGLFQGTPISDPSRTVVRNRDDFNIDAKIAELEAAIASGSIAATVQETLTNTSGATVLAYHGVSTQFTGTMELIDLTTEASALGFRGIAAAQITNGLSGDVVSSGRIENVTTGFAFGDSLFLARDGSLTNVAPEIGSNGWVAGDFVIYIGSVVQNQTNGANKDFFILPSPPVQL